MPETRVAQLAELKLPAQDDFIGLAKRVATSLGGMLGFDLEKIDELAIAVTQICASAIQAAEETWGPGATLKLTFSEIESGIGFDLETIAPTAQESLQVRRRTPVHDRAREVREVEDEIQRAVAREMIRLFVDDFRHQVDAGRRQVRYRMVKYLIR